VTGLAIFTKQSRIEWDDKRLAKQKKNIKLWILIAAVLIVILPLVWYLAVRLEGEKPAVVLEFSSAFISQSQDLAVSISDAKSGVRKIWISLVKGGQEISLFEENFPSVGLGRGGSIHDRQIRFKVDAGKLGLSDGDAMLRLAVWDYSWRGWFDGNVTYLEKTITIDTVPPEIEVYSKAHNVSQGGTGLVIYRISEPSPMSGVKVGDHFFPGRTAGFKDPQVMMAFFALSHTQGPGTDIIINAVDRAGNTSKAGLTHYIRRKRFKKDTIKISDNFLNRKLPEFSASLSQATAATAVEKFLFINQNLRRADYDQIRQICETSESKLLWKGTFKRLPRSAPRAGYADHRTYKYNGHVIDNQFHLGVDLASVERSPVPTANHGVVVFADRMGIYGRTVFIDHGFGLFSMYAHLNTISVKVGQKLKKGDIIGRTGSTGLAGGDHLHFGMLIQHTFVNPIEWWDAAWIKNNITSKIDRVKSRLE
jgi:murein DD-endopeptidase MepM/ murein hydrolase activator NlpD